VTIKIQNINHIHYHLETLTVYKDTTPIEVKEIVSEDVEWTHLTRVKDQARPVVNNIMKLPATPKRRVFIFQPND
jgi:hypothetical protein